MSEKEFGCECGHVQDAHGVYEWYVPSGEDGLSGHEEWYFTGCTLCDCSLYKFRDPMNPTRMCRQ